MDVRDSLLIGGRWQVSDANPPIAVVSPATEEVIGSIASASASDVDAAVTAARCSVDEGSWRLLPVEERIELLERALKLLDGRADQIANLVTAQMGQPLAISRQKTPAAIWTGRYFLDLARTESATEIRDTRWGPTAVLKEPVGVVAAIAPWNSPFNMAIAKVIPALVAGCSVVYKPAPETPLDAFVLADALVEAGVPDGAFNLVSGGAEVGRQLVSHRGVDKVSFTGSTAAGREIARVAGPNFTRLQLELGGKSAAIIGEDADRATTLRGIADGSFANTGQVCSAFSRILVPAGQHDEWVDVVVAAAESFQIGDPYDEATTMGPVVSLAQRDRVLGYINQGLEDGASIAAGGGVPDEPSHGYYVEPTVFVNAHNAMRISREEIFGPVVVVIPYGSLDEAIAIANDSEYGLHGGVFTEDPQVAAHVARSVRSGTFTVNAFTHNAQAPFGGVKDSGMGRELGREGLNAYYELKTINLTTKTESAFAN